MKIGFMGSGAISEILCQNAISSGIITPKEIFLYDVNSDRMEYMNSKYGFTLCKDADEMISSSDYIFMCVRSDDAIEMAKSLHSNYFKDKVIISISAGIPMELYEKSVPGAAVARALPNPPSRIGSGVIAISFNRSVTDSKKEDIMKIFNAMGTCLVVAEDKINAITALTGPAPVYAFFQGLVESSLLLGIDHKTSAELAFKTVQGCLKVWEKNIDNISGLLSETSTPGGISVRQLYALEQKSFKAIIKNCYEEGFLRTKAYSDSIIKLLEEKNKDYF